MNFYSYRTIWYFFILCSFCFTPKLFSQSITPFSLNNGGGSASSIEWSIGESVSIANFITPNFLLNTGLLQPFTNVVTFINEYGPVVYGHQITISPNPTTNLVHLKGQFNEMGRLSFQVIDSKSFVLLTHEAGTNVSSYEKDILLDNYPSGIFYIKVIFKPNYGIIKTGIFKIVKL
jgi:hypothetical protein